MSNNINSNSSTPFPSYSKQLSTPASNPPSTYGYQFTDISKKIKLPNSDRINLEEVEKIISNVQKDAGELEILRELQAVIKGRITQIESQISSDDSLVKNELMEEQARLTKLINAIKDTQEFININKQADSKPSITGQEEPSSPIPPSSKEASEIALQSKLQKFKEPEEIEEDEEFIKGFEIWESYLCEMPPNSSFADTDLIIIKDEYQGQMPLNAIKESEFKKIQTLFDDICKGNTVIKIDNTTSPPDFSNHIQTDIKTLLTRSIGRKLIAKICERPRPLIITLGKRSLINKDTIEIALIPDVKFGIHPTRGREPYQTLRFISLGHEMIHAIHPKADLNVNLPPSMENEYGNLEEQMTITGLAHDLSNPEALSSDKESFEPILPKDYDELNERNLTAAFRNSQNVWLPRFGHKALSQDDYWNLLFKNQQFHDLEELLEKQKNDFESFLEKSVVDPEILKSFPNSLFTQPEFFIKLLITFLKDNPGNIGYFSEGLNQICNILAIAEANDPHLLNATIQQFNPLNSNEKELQKFIKVYTKDIFKNRLEMITKNQELCTLLFPELFDDLGKIDIKYFINTSKINKILIDNLLNHPERVERLNESQQEQTKQLIDQLIIDTSYFTNPIPLFKSLKLHEDEKISQLFSSAISTIFENQNVYKENKKIFQKIEPYEMWALHYRKTYNFSDILIDYLADFCLIAKNRFTSQEKDQIKKLLFTTLLKNADAHRPKRGNYNYIFNRRVQSILDHLQ